MKTLIVLSICTFFLKTCKKKSVWFSLYCISSIMWEFTKGGQARTTAYIGKKWTRQPPSGSTSQQLPQGTQPAHLEVLVLSSTAFLQPSSGTCEWGLIDQGNQQGWSSPFTNSLSVISYARVICIEGRETVSRTSSTYCFKQSNSDTLWK